MTTALATPTLARTRAQLSAALARQDATTPRRGGRHRAVVMTMGALHAGHLSLVAQARELAEHVVVTIFVNPLQFGAGEDLDRYPRDLAGDIALLTGPGLLRDGDVVFAPEPGEVYPDGDPLVRVSAGRLGEVLEGAARPGHFDGVLTVVLKLLHLTRPGVAIFGRKDAQQLVAIRRMVRDLDLDVDVVGAPLVRDADGLALSSRNAYLSDDERARALALSAALRAAAAAAGHGTPDDVRAAALALLGDVDVDYVAVVDPDDLTDLPADHAGDALVALAARVGATRLIDNTTVHLGAARGQEGTR